MSQVNDYIAGAVGGAAGLIVGHPFDTTKVQMQISQTSSPYRGTWHAMTSINKHGMVRGFFRGMGFPLTSYGIVNSVFFGVYGNTLAWCKGEDKQRGVRYSEVFLAGCVGGFAQLIVACPVDLIKVVLQSQISSKSGTSFGSYYKGPLQCAAAVYKARGIRGLYRGLVIMGFRDLPASSSYFVIYEWTYSKMYAAGLSDSRGVFASLISGGIAGVLSWLIIMPLDVVKSHFQADFSGVKYTSIIQCTRDLYRKNGIKAFGTGFIPCALRAFPVNAVIFAVHKQVLSMLSSREE